MTIEPIHAEIDGDVVTMARAEFERLLGLLEDSEDVAAFDAARRTIDAGEEELLPAAFVDRLLSGENPVRVWREHRGLTGKVLAERAGISAPYLAQIEAGRRKPSMSVLRALAATLRVGIGDVV